MALMLPFAQSKGVVDSMTSKLAAVSRVDCNYYKRGTSNVYILKAFASMSRILNMKKGECCTLGTAKLVGQRTQDAVDDIGYNNNPARQS